MSKKSIDEQILELTEQAYYGTGPIFAKTAKQHEEWMRLRAQIDKLVEEKNKLERKKN